MHRSTVIHLTLTPLPTNIGLSVCDLCKVIVVHDGTIVVYRPCTSIISPNIGLCLRQGCSNPRWKADSCADGAGQ